MTKFMRLVWHEDKKAKLSEISNSYRSGREVDDVFKIEPSDFNVVPGSPFAYWVTPNVRETFSRFEKLENEGVQALHGASSKDDFRFVRLWWEIDSTNGDKWFPFSKGGEESAYYMDFSTYINWENDAREIEAAALNKYPYLEDANWILHKEQPYLSPVIYQTLRARKLAPYLTPKGCYFGDNGFQISVPEGCIFSYLAILNSSAANGIFSLLLGRAGYAIYRNGTARKLPMPPIEKIEESGIENLAKKIWATHKKLDSRNEESHFFNANIFFEFYKKPEIILNELEDISIVQREIDELSYSIYGLNDSDRSSIEAAALLDFDDSTNESTEASKDFSEDETSSLKTQLCTWAVGVVFGRFKGASAITEASLWNEGDPLDPLPAKSPSMPSGGEEPASIMVDDEGHQHDLPRLVEQVLETVDEQVSQDLRRWLRRDFFQFHLQRYSKSRRKAPVYWPLSTASGNYTLWLYYPELTSQTLFTAVNDFVEPKLNSVRDDLNSLRTKGGSRSKQEEKELEKLEDLEQELADLRDTLLEIAPGYRPNQDDGVQITAAPLWSFFRHKPWQKVLKDTWSKLEKGDYDWAHMALNCWPDRVLHKCHEDRSLAIAHDVEGEFWEEVEVPVIRRGKDTGETKLEWQPKNLSEAQLQVLINQIRQERSL